MNLTHFLSIAIFFYIINCNKVITNRDNIEFNSTLQKMRADSFVLDIPKVSGGEDYISYYDQVLEAARDLKLKPLTNGVDSIEIRVWFNYYGNSQQCLRFFWESEKWQAQLITAHYTPPKDKQSKWTVVSSVEKKQPKNEWEIFLQKAIELEILTLPDCHKLSGYSFTTDGSSLSVFEIATKHLYRLYGYVNPSEFRNEIKEANKVEQLLELMQTEFDFKMLGEI